MNDLTTENLTSGRVIEAAIGVHKRLGPGLLESIYEEALCHELRLRGILVERQRAVEVVYKGMSIKGLRVDLIVEDSVVVELKACTDNTTIYQAQLLSYLKITGCRIGLLLNFHKLRLADGITRLIL